MTKKTSIVLAALFAVSGFLPCHADRVTIDEENHSWWWKGDGSSKGVVALYDENTALIEDIDKMIKKAISLGYNGLQNANPTDDDLASKIQTAFGALTSNQNTDQIKALNQSITGKLNNLKTLVDKAKEAGIDVNNSKPVPTSHHTTSGGSGGFHGF